MTSKGLKRTCTFLARWAILAKVERYLDGLLKVTTTNAFDPFGRLTGIEQKNSGGVIGSDSYVLDDLNRLTAQTKDGVGRAIGYDDTDQVVGVSGGSNEGYSYDKNGNRLNAGYVTASGNRLMSDGVYDYLYDPEGNRTQRTNVATQAVDLYTWDYRNRLTGIVSKTSVTGTVTRTVGYEYDVDDQRVKKTIDGVVENYFIDRDQVAFVTDGGGSRTEHYLYGLNVDAVMAQDSSAGMLWALADRLGSVDTLTDADGVVVDQRTFDSFGRVLNQTNPSVSFRYGYTGRELDLESGLNYYRARYYDSNVGRFISVDPMGFGAGDTNLYRYVGNNSTNATDPTGMLSLDDIGNYAYGGLENTDKFVAGFAHLVTGGYTTQLRNEVYGDRVAGQHEGWLFNAGQVAGFGVSLALGFATPNALAGVGAAARVAQVYELAQAGKGAYDTTTKILDGKMDWRNPLSYLEVAGSFAPAIGVGAGAAWSKYTRLDRVGKSLDNMAAETQDLIRQLDGTFPARSTPGNNANRFEQIADPWLSPANSPVRGNLGGSFDPHPTPSNVPPRMLPGKVEGVDFFREVELINNNRSPVGELDEIDLTRRIFFEDKQARGLDIVNPYTGKIQQTPEKFVNKSIVKKTRERIKALSSTAVGTRPKADGTPNVPSLEEIKDIREFVFRLEGDSPDLRKAVDNGLDTLRQEFPNYYFSARFGHKN